MHSLIFEPGADNLNAKWHQRVQRFCELPTEKIKISGKRVRRSKDVRELREAARRRN
jgi:hypothetical protein